MDSSFSQSFGQKLLQADILSQGIWLCADHSKQQKAHVNEVSLVPSLCIQKPQIQWRIFRQLGFGVLLTTTMSLCVGVIRKGYVI